MLEDIKNFFKEKIMLKKSKSIKLSPFVIFVLVLAIIIPTVFAIFYAHFYDDSVSLSSSTVEILLYDGEGVLLSSDKVSEVDISSSPFMRSIHGILASRQGMSSAPSLDRESNFKIICNYKDSSESFSCYFAASYAESYIQDASGTFYSIGEEYYKEFLTLDVSEAVHTEATPPLLVTGDGETVLPSEVDWYYKNQNGNTIKSKSYTLANEDVTYKIAGAISVAFEVEPDECTAQIHDIDGNELFNGSLAELPFVTIHAGETVKAKISAEWKESDGRAFYGKVSFSFNVTLVNRAEFYTSADTVQAGSFIVLSVKNADNLSKIIYSSSGTESPTDLLTVLSTEDESIEQDSVSFLYGYRPSFVKDGEYARAIIPFPAGTPSGSFYFNLSYGASQQTFTINVEQRSESPEYSFEKDASAIAAALSDESLSDLKNILNGVATPAQAMIFMRGEFAAMTDFSEGYAYGETATDADGFSLFEALGNEYLATSPGGQSVKAPNVGVVVDSGYCTYLGNYVVLEHGMGLRTWYCGLSDINVQIGDIVAKGDTLGKSGTDSLTSTSGVLVLCSVYETLIDPSFILGKEIIYVR